MAPPSNGAGGSSEAAGESIDHRIGADLNPDGRESLFMYAGRNSGWLGGACISYRAPGQRRAPFHNPLNAYDAVAGIASAPPEALNQLAERSRSINDLVRGQMTRLLGLSRLSAADRDRLSLHFDSIRDLEVSLSCRMTQAQEAELDGADAFFDSDNGDETLATARLHMDIAAVAIACGYTRSVSIQVGNGNDGVTRYRNLSNGELMENFHYLSHRRLSHDSSGSVISGADLLHHYVDRQFAQTFNHLLDRLAAYQVPGGGSLLDQGVAAWFNDNGNGPGHSSRNLPWVVAGSGGGLLRQGEYLELAGGNNTPNHHRLLATLGNAAGMRNADGTLFDSFGDPELGGGLLDEALA